MSQITAWAHLPNAALIDEVLASLEAHPKKWDTARGAAWGAARGAAWDAIAVLIAYDDMGELIKQPLPHLQGLYRLDPHPAFLLFQPASLVFNQLEFKT